MHRMRFRLAVHRPCSRCSAPALKAHAWPQLYINTLCSPPFLRNHLPHARQPTYVIGASSVRDSMKANSNSHWASSSALFAAFLVYYVALVRTRFRVGPAAAAAWRHGGYREHRERPWWHSPPWLPFPAVCPSKRVALHACNVACMHADHTGRAAALAHATRRARRRPGASVLRDARTDARARAVYAASRPAGQRLHVHVSKPGLHPCLAAYVSPACMAALGAGALAAVGPLGTGLLPLHVARALCPIMEPRCPAPTCAHVRMCACVHACRSPCRSWTTPPST